MLLVVGLLLSACYRLFAMAQTSGDYDVFAPLLPDFFCGRAEVVIGVRISPGFYIAVAASLFLALIKRRHEYRLWGITELTPRGAR